MKRRAALKSLGCGAAAATLPQSGLLTAVASSFHNACAFAGAKQLSSKEARYYEKIKDGGVECHLCPRKCRVTDLERGYCGVRENRGDVYHTLVYGLPCALNVDPIEKKPLFHFLPGTEAFSLATAGCNVQCKCCQNWEISQSRPEQTDNFSLPPAAAVTQCRQRRVPTIAYTYSEPAIFYEYMFDIAELGRKDGIKSVMISGGFMEPEPLAALMVHLDAIKVDLKAIRENFYRNYVDGQLKPVLDRLVQIRTAGMWLEVVYLVIPTLNDSDQEFRELARWIKGNLGAEVPLHFSRFHPQYLLTKLPPTPLNTLDRAYQIAAAEGLPYVYLGNVPGHRAESTFCAKCGKIVIERHGYRIGKTNLAGNRCASCGHTIPGRFA